ncbi:CheB methylesterase domain-containing protein, partial [Planctomycetota bacterium]
IAPGGKHMEIARRGAKDEYILKITSKAPVHSCRPSVDVLFSSLAANYEGRCLALVLTGMGSDGRDGVIALKDKDAYCIAQDEGTSVVFGMPKAVIESDCADEILPAEDIAERINALVKKG